MALTTERAAYVAGAIDGEGWIGIKRKSVDEAGWVRSPRFSPAMQIANTDRRWLETLQAWCGGSITRVDARDIKNRRPCYSLRFRVSELVPLISAVMPYLLIKRRQAELLLQFIPLGAQRRAYNGLKVKPNDGADQAIVAQQQAFYDEFRKLNQRGAVMQNYAPLTPRQPRMCSFDGCERKHYGHGYCWIHYRKFIVRGGPALHERECKECGKPFVARRSDAAFCSKECSGKAYYKVRGEAIRARVADRRKRLTSQE